MGNLYPTLVRSTVMEDHPSQAPGIIPTIPILPVLSVLPVLPALKALPALRQLLSQGF